MASDYEKRRRARRHLAFEAALAAVDNLAGLLFDQSAFETADKVTGIHEQLVTLRDQGTEAVPLPMPATWRVWRFQVGPNAWTIIESGSEAQMRASAERQNREASQSNAGTRFYAQPESHHPVS